MIVLGIETSCDETAAAVVRDDRTILSNVVLSQLDEHRPFGGVVPEIAARSHLEHLPGIIGRVMTEAKIGFEDIDAVAATAGPGLIGGVMVGLMSAKAIALVHDLPFFGVNHMAAHALTPRLTGNVGFPYLALLVSGGHCQLVAAAAPDDFEIYGTTVDDAIGEAFDKTASLLGLSYPGGPAVETAAATGNPDTYSLPRPMLGRPNCDFSFSGLKTAMRKTIERIQPDGINERMRADLAASFQAAVADVVADRTRNAVQRFQAKHPGGRTLVVAGGVASNRAIRAALRAVADEVDLEFIAPPPSLCTDNGAMVAWAGIEMMRSGKASSLDFAPRPRWPLDELRSARQG